VIGWAPAAGLVCAPFALPEPNTAETVTPETGSPDAFFTCALTNCVLSAPEPAAIGLAVAEGPTSVMDFTASCAAFAPAVVSVSFVPPAVKVAVAVAVGSPASKAWLPFVSTKARMLAPPAVRPRTPNV